MGKGTNGDKVSEDVIFNSIVKEAGGFYTLVLTVASAFLGGTLFFLEKIVGTPNKYSLILLGLGWMSLITTIGLSAFIRFQNVESGRLALEKKYNEAKKLDRDKEAKCILMIWTLIIGILFIAIFGIINLWIKII
ncbi:hypothetical protein KAR34_00480 [bacterium]|nr:hypothetical protein [bacterium]